MKVENKYPKITIASGLQQFGIYVGFDFPDEKIGEYIAELKTLIEKKRMAMAELEAKLNSIEDQ